MPVEVTKTGEPRLGLHFYRDLAGNVGLTIELWNRRLDAWLPLGWKPKKWRAWERKAQLGRYEVSLWFDNIFLSLGFSAGVDGLVRYFDLYLGVVNISVEVV